MRGRTVLGISLQCTVHSRDAGTAGATPDLSPQHALRCTPPHNAIPGQPPAKTPALKTRELKSFFNNRPTPFRPGTGRRYTTLHLSLLVLCSAESKRPRTHPSHAIHRLCFCSLKLTQLYLAFPSFVFSCTERTFMSN